jgi:NTE family protein
MTLNQPNLRANSSVFDPTATNWKPCRMSERPPFERIALLLQGGGALGAYQAGVYQALAEANLHPDWVGGISIGAVNAALIVGNPPDKRIDRLRDFWQAVTGSPLGIPYFQWIDISNSLTHRLFNQTRALAVLLFGAPHFFTPRLLPPIFWPTSNVESVGYYDVTGLKATLDRLVDFDLINTGDIRLRVGAVNVRTGNFTYFDSATHRIGPAHIMASTSLPPGFPATEVEGEYYWDGGVVSNTPLSWVLDANPRQDTLAFQVDLWSAAGELPHDLIAAEVRQKEIHYSSRTRSETDHYKEIQKLRVALAKLLKDLPEELLNRPETKLIAAEADEKVCNIVHLIYRAKCYEGIAKDYEFARRNMEVHWQFGYQDAVRALSHPEVIERPTQSDGVRTFDFVSTDWGPRRHDDRWSRPDTKAA